MTLADLVQYNADWLRAWTDKDVEGLCGFYAEDCVYKDQQTPAGLVGVAALRAYLMGLFAATPRMVYTPDEVWTIEGGFCGRWHCAIGEGPGAPHLRGFDLVILRGARIALNEVYVHTLPA